MLVEIDVLILDAAPQAFAEYVVEGAASAIHADLDVGSEQAGGEGIVSVLDFLQLFPDEDSASEYIEMIR